MGRRCRFSRRSDRRPCRYAISCQRGSRDGRDCEGCRMDQAGANQRGRRRQGRRRRRDSTAQKGRWTRGSRRSQHRRWGVTQRRKSRSNTGQRSPGERDTIPGGNDVPARGAFALVASKLEMRGIVGWGLVPVPSERERFIGMAELPLWEVVSAPVCCAAWWTHGVGRHTALIPMTLMCSAMNMLFGGPLVAREAIPTVVPALVGGVPRSRPPQERAFDCTENDVPIRIARGL